MESSSPVVLRNSNRMVAIAIAGMSLAATALVIYLLNGSYQRYQASAAETSQNLALSLANYLHGHFQATDLALQSATDEFRLLQQQQQFDPDSFSAYLRTLRQRVPDAIAVRATDRNGTVAYGESVNQALAPNLDNREFFQRVRNQRTLVFGLPVKSRITGQWVLPILRPLQYPDGAFGGAVYINTSKDMLMRVLGSLKLGEHGVIVMFDRERRVLLRYPELAELQEEQLIRVRAPEILAALAAGKRVATDSARSAVDGRMRTLTYQRIGDYPVFVSVGLAEEDYLAPWRHECWIGGIFLGALAGGALLLYFSIRRYWQMQLQLQSLDATRESNEHLAALLKAIPDLLFELDIDGRYLDYRALNQDLLIVPYPQFIGRTVCEVLPAPAADAVLAALREAGHKGVAYGTQICLQVPAGEVWFELSVARKVDFRSGRCSFIVLSRDISERRQAEMQIEQLAFSDALTRLPNRRVFIDRLQQSMANSERSQRYRALLFLDLDKFKTLNDTRGHQLGDRLLVETADRLRRAVREGDTVARLGGDEFVVILEQLSEDSREASSQSMHAAEKIVEMLRVEYDLDGFAYRGSTSIGIALFRGHEVSSDELLKRADLAMYQAKAAGRDTVRFFDPQTQANIESRMALEVELQHAVFNEEFILHYQPQIDSQGKCIGAEALVRWNSAKHGAVSPASFIPLAEETGLILPIGHRVLREACMRLQQWQHNPLLARLTLAVNVSARQFGLPTFVEEVRQMIGFYGVNPALLKLELTESMLIDHIDEAIAKMQQLRAIGIQFSLDDFGTGFSCLSYLKRLPFSQIKIDQSFARDVLSDANDAAICRTIIALGGNLGLEVIAEGVETAAQWSFLRAEGCQRAQGYLISRPMPGGEFETWVQHLGAAA